MCPQMSEVAKSTKTVAGCGVSLGIYAKSITPIWVAWQGLQSRRIGRIDTSFYPWRAGSFRRLASVQGWSTVTTTARRPSVATSATGKALGSTSPTCTRAPFIPAWSPAAGSGIALCAGQRSKNGGARRSPQLSNGPTTKACSLSWSR